MSSVKRFSFILMFIALIISGCFALNFPLKKVYAEENNFIVLSVEKISYKNNFIYKDENGKILGDTNNNGVIDGDETESPVEFGKIGMLKGGELYNNFEELGISTLSNIENNEVTSINEDESEAILVKFMPNTEFGSIIKILNPSLKINGTSILIDTYSIGGNSENRIFMMAFDFTTLKNSLAQDVSNLSGKYEFIFNYSYTTNGTNVISDTSSFNFYLISDNDYFNNNNLPTITGITSSTDNTYYYNYQTAETPNLIYNPKKFQPTINFVYNETLVTLETNLNGNQVIVTSNNEQIIDSEELEIVDNKVSLNLNRLGQYSINYNLVVDNFSSIEVIPTEQTQNLKKFPVHSLYIYGFETYYTHYNETDTRISHYKQFHNEKYLSDFSYKINGATDIESAIANLDASDYEKIAVTNQAPVKIDSYITELISAKYVKLDDNFKSTGNSKDFSTSKRFGSDENETGVFAVFLNYNFGTRKDLTQLIVFKIENSTPQLTFTDVEGNALPNNNFTNKSVKVSWSGVSDNPFSVAPKITFTKDGTNYNYNNNDHYTILNDSGEYLVTIKYGINLTTSVTKGFAIDKENISFALYNVNKNLETNSYELSNKLNKINRQDNVVEYQTNAPFSIFALNKAVKSNLISVKWEYLPIDTDNDEILYEYIDGKLYIYNNRILSNVYTDLDYINAKLNNLTSFDNFTNYNFENNNTSVITISGLHKFTITDYAGNSNSFFVMLDNTDPIVLHTNDLYNGSIDYDSSEGVDKSINAWLNYRKSENDLKVKNVGRNLVSNNYSLIVGNGKFVKFNTDIAKDFAKEYFNSEVNGVHNIYQNYTNFKFIQLDGEDLSDNYNINSNNIASITAPTIELEANFRASFNFGGQEYFREFNLNTDKNQILIYGYNETDGYYRIYTNDNENITNTKYLYIRFIDEAEDEYKLDSLTLDFRPFAENALDENNSYLKFGSTTSLDLLAIKQTNNIATNEANGVLGDGYITSLINPTFKNNEYVTNQGKYILTKTYRGYHINSEAYPKATKTFYVDRHSPIEVFSNTLTIGSNIEFTFNDDATLSADNILYYIQNKESVVTNKLPITSSVVLNNKKYANSTDNEFKNFVIFYEIYKGSIADNVCVYSSDPTSKFYLPKGYNFTKTGEYTFRIFDNSGYKFGDLKNSNPNSLTFVIEISNASPNGSFIVDGNEEIIEKVSSTNSNSLSFTFTDSTSEFLYDIDIYNILLTRNGTNILKTYKQQTANDSRYVFNLNGIMVYYESPLGGIFKLERTKLSSTKIPNDKTPRYSYKLTIIDPNFNSELVENKISKEAEYKLTISYTTSNAILSGENYAQKEYILYIDHTSPYSNVNRYIDSDQFLTLYEKEILKQSFKNKDRNSQINFENYTFIINEAPTTFKDGLALLDTSNVYIRQYNKYNDSNISDYQSLVPGDSEYDKQITTRYKFDVNALDANSNFIYSSSSYDIKDLSSFFKNAGFYEIIEIDNAQNYTVYSVYYNPDYSFSLDYSFVKDTASISGGREDKDNIETDSIANGLNFTLDKININEKDYLNIVLTINGKQENLRYLPFELEGANTKYFTSLSTLIEYINTSIQNDSQVNALGSQYIIEVSNRLGTKITITNNTPNEQIELNIVDFSNYFTVTLPNNDKATWVSSFKVYPVIDGKVRTEPLEKDSDGKLITSMPNSSYRFTNKVDNLNISIYYIEWTDNFNRTQFKVKTIGIQDIKYIDYGTSNFVTLNNLDYTKNENATLVYAKNLYSIEIYYSILPDLSLNRLLLTSEDMNIQAQINNFIQTNNNIVTINLLQILNVFNEVSVFENEIQFTIYLTDLSTLAFNENVNEIIYTLSYVYYPTMPVISFVDSGSNNLNIQPLTLNSTTVSTSKNVTLSYNNNTLFDIQISATREYVNDLGLSVTVDIANISNEHTFTELGTYTITVTNELGSQNIYQFSIKTASNKTYTVYTLEPNMENFEVTASPVKLTYNIDGNNIPCETYFSIYNTTVEVNTDFNLEAQIIKLDDGRTTIYKIVKKDTESVYKYIATVKADYDSNFLKINNQEGALINITQGIDESTNIANNLSGFSIKITDASLKIDLPLYNTLPGNNINVTIYYNNKPIELNKNIYYSFEETQTILLEKVPAGVYSFYFEDLAGNTQLFNGNSFLNVYMLTEVIISINNSNPIDYQIYNSTVNLKIEQEKQYNTRSIKITGYKNGDLIEKLNRNTMGEYVFTEYGLYTVQITANITVDGKELPIYKTIHFTILNENVAFKEFSYIGLNGQTISKIVRDGVDITNDIKKFVNEGNSLTDPSVYSNAILYNLNLASVMKYYYKENGEIIVDEDGNEIFDTFNGAGKYEIFVDNQNSLIDSQTFKFNVWIRENDVKILLKASIKEGDSTSKAIKFTFNPYLIYTQIGECSIYLNENEVVEINSESENAVHHFTIARSAKGTFIVQVRSDNGNTELSFIVNKKEPLSTVTIIVIVLVSVVVAGGAFLFIKLRTRMKVK